MDSPLELAGIELYCDDLARARAFYSDVLGLRLAEQDPERFAQFTTGGAFLCVERKGVEDYPSQEKAVVFLETEDLERAIERIGAARFVRIERDAARPWAVLHDPDGHNVVIVQAGET